MTIFDSPFIVPVAGCAVGACAIVGGIYSDIRNKELRSQERLAMLHRGVPMEEIERLTSKAREDDETKVRDPLRSLANARRAGVVLVSVGLGLGVFGVLLFAILQVRPVLVVAAVGVINLCIGAGFLVDYNMQKRELSRFGMEVEAESSLR
jgi:Flp pilus assembly protein TadB